MVYSKQEENMKLSERAMLMTLHTGSWAGQVIDQTVTDAANAKYHAEDDAGHYKKKIVSGKFLSHVNSKINVAAKIHKSLTLPWEDGGTRILSALGYDRYTEEMRLARHSVEAAASEFIDNMPAAIEEAKTRLKDMFRLEDYPSRDELKGKFYIDVEPKPVPESGDFRTSLSAATVKSITDDIERRANDRVEMAVRDIYQRVAEATGKMVERLRDPNGNFHGTLVSNVETLAKLLPTLNITGDAAIDALSKQMLRDLTEHSPEILRADTGARQSTAAKAEKIFAKAKLFLG